MLLVWPTLPGAYWLTQYASPQEGFSSPLSSLASPSTPSSLGPSLSSTSGIGTSPSQRSLQSLLGKCVRAGANPVYILLPSWWGHLSLWDETSVKEEGSLDVLSSPGLSRLVPRARVVLAEAGT